MIELGHTGDTLVLAVIVAGTLAGIALVAFKAYLGVKVREMNILISCLQNLNQITVELAYLADTIERTK